MLDRDAFSAALSQWLHELTTTETPAAPMAAYRFGLSEVEDGYLLYLAGSLTYAADSEEWATDLPDFIAENELLISVEEDSEWYWVLLEVMYCLGRLLRASQLQASYLGNTPIYTGFVDGDLYRLL